MPPVMRNPVNENTVSNFRAPPTRMASDSLRQRLTEANSHLNQMKDEEKRVLRQQQQVLNNLKGENEKLRNRLESLRMQECLSLAELEVFNLNAGAGNNKSDATLNMEHPSCLLPFSPKYQAAKDLIQRKRSECSVVESKLNLTQQRWRELYRQHEKQKRDALNHACGAKRQEFLSRQQTSQARHQLRTLEQYIEVELERLSMMARKAKSLRASVDALLISEANFEKSYRSRANDLLEKRKQMSFIVEICNILNEERQIRLHELVQLKATADAGNAMYQRVMNELHASLEENESQQKGHVSKVSQLQQSLREAQRDRSRIEQGAEVLRGHGSPVVAAAKSTTSAMQSTLGGRKRDAPDAGATTTMDTADSRAEGGDILEESPPSLEEYESIYERLGQLVGSTDVEDVVGYLRSCNERRFRLFSELNYLDRQSREAGRGRRLSASNAPGHSAQGDPTHAKRVQLQERLNALQREARELRQRSEASDALLAHLAESIGFLFSALGCSFAALRERTGMENVSAGTLSECLALIDQRLEEYLVAFAQKEHQTHKQRQSGVRPPSCVGISIQTRLQLRGPAQTVLHRPDLIEKGRDAARSIVEKASLPRSNALSRLEYEEGSHGSKENRVLSPFPPLI